jgi:hypothetical protein
LAQIPVNVIYYGAHGTEPWKVDPTQHLGFLFTLLGFTVAATPAAWGMIKQYVRLILGARVPHLGQQFFGPCFFAVWFPGRPWVLCAVMKLQ